MHIDILDGPTSMLRLRNDWQQVCDKDPDATYFMYWHWIDECMKLWQVQFVVLAARQTPEEPYCAFLPLQLQTRCDSAGKCRNELRLAGGYHSGYNGFICDPTCEDEAIDSFAATLKTLRWTDLHLENIHTSQDRLERFLDAFKPEDFDISRVQRPDDGDGIDHDIYVSVDLPDTWEAFLSDQLGAATRKTARRALRDTEGDGEFHIKLPTAETFPDDLDALVSLWEAQWGPKLAARYNPSVPRSMLAFFRAQLTRSFEQGSLFMPVLWRGDSRVGVQASFVDRHNRSLIGLANGRDLGIRKPAPGFVLHLYSVRWAVEQGLRTYDMQTGNFAYKYDFGGRETVVKCLRIRTRSGENLHSQLEPRTVTAAFEIGRRFLHNGNANAAEQVARQLLALDKADYGAIALLGHARLLEGDMPAAEACFGAALVLRPDAPVALYNLALAMTNRGKQAEALVHLDKALARSPNQAQIIELRAEVLAVMASAAPAARALGTV